MTWVMRRALVLRQTCRHAREKRHAASLHRAHQGRALGDGQSRHAPRGDRAARRACSRSTAWRPASTPRRPSRARRAAGSFPAPGPSTAEAAIHAMEAVQRFVRAFTYEHVPVARGPGGRHALGAAAQAARERDGSALARAAELHGRRASGAGPLVPLRDQQMAGDAHVLVGRPPRAAAERGREDGRACRASPTSDHRRRSAAAEPTRGSRRAASRSRCTASASWTSPGSWPRPAAPGSCAPSAPRASRWKSKSHPDTRMAAMAPVGGRAARERATAPLPGVSDPDMGGQFNNKNPGKRGISLNVRHPKGLEIARRLVAMSDVVAEGFSPGVLDSWGLGYDALRAIKPDIIYVQQSGMGAQGTYGRFRTVGPIANSFSGLSEMSGLARAGDAGRVGLLVPGLDGRLQLRARDAHRDSSIAPAPGEGSGSTPRSPRSASSSAARPSWTGRPTAGSGHATATVRRTSRRRRTTSIPAPGTIAGSPSRASRTRSGVR